MKIEEKISKDYYDNHVIKPGDIIGIKYNNNLLDYNLVVKLLDDNELSVFTFYSIKNGIPFSFRPLEIGNENLTIANIKEYIGSEYDLYIIDIEATVTSITLI